MSFLKKNYEKVLLGAVLLGLVGVLLYLPAKIAYDQEQIELTATRIIQRAPNPLAPLDMSQEINATNRAASPYTLDFETTNRLFNPVQWQKTPDGRWIKIATGKEVGPGAVVVTKIIPLNYILRLSSIEASNQFSPARFNLTMEDQNAAVPSQRHRSHYLSVGDKDEALSLLSATGPPDNPTLSVQIIDTGETVTVTKSKPYQRVDGYACDLKYPPLTRTWLYQRVGADIKFDNNDYIVVVIDTNQVVILAQSNQKKTTLPYQP